MPPFTHELRVRYAECDAQGRVFNAHYLTWFDLAHTELLREAIGSYTEIVGRGVELVVGEANARYRGAARFDELIQLDVALDPIGTTSLTSRFTVRRGDDLLTEGWLRHVCVDANSFAKKPWPGWMKEALAPYVE